MIGSRIVHHTRRMTSCRTQAAVRSTNGRSGVIQRLRAVKTVTLSASGPGVRRARNRPRARITLSGWGLDHRLRECASSSLSHQQCHHGMILLPGNYQEKCISSRHTTCTPQTHTPPLSPCSYRGAPHYSLLWPVAGLSAGAARRRVPLPPPAGNATVARQRRLTQRVKRIFH